MYEIIMTGPDVLTVALHAQLCESCDGFLQHYSVLGNMALDKGSMAYHVVPKFHALWHICNDALLNPRLFWTYSGEDLAGYIATIATSVTKGNPHIDLPHIILDKLWKGVAMKLND